MHAVLGATCQHMTFSCS